MNADGLRVNIQFSMVNTCKLSVLFGMICIHGDVVRSPGTGRCSSIITCSTYFREKGWSRPVIWLCGYAGCRVGEAAHPGPKCPACDVRMSRVHVGQCCMCEANAGSASSDGASAITFVRCHPCDSCICMRCLTPNFLGSLSIGGGHEEVVNDQTIMLSRRTTWTSRTMMSTM